MQQHLNNFWQIGFAIGFEARISKQLFSISDRFSKRNALEELIASDVYNGPGKIVYINNKYACEI